MSEYLKDIESTIIRSIVSSIPLMIILIAVPVLSINSFLKPANEDVWEWFQRSGALMVILSVWIEVNLYKSSNHIYLAGFDLGGPEEKLANKFKLKFSFVKYFGVAGALSGTFIWGYGDVFYKLFTLH